jgi:xylulose-5-phosphate/fructose-6-phosphate phosphoketolase
MTELSDRYRMTSPEKRTTLDKVDAWWRAANHVAAGLPGGSGPSIPAVTLAYAHLNRMIVRRQLRMRFVLGLRDSMAALEAVARMEGTHAMGAPPSGFAATGGPSYAQAYAIGRALDEPGLTVACMVSEDEALSSWQVRALHDPTTDGAVLPILYRPTMDCDQLRSVFGARGWEPIEIGGGTTVADTGELHRSFAGALYVALDEIAAITAAASTDHPARRAHWPMLVLRTPVDWPPAVSVVPAEWFDENGRPVPEIAQAAPTGDMRMSADG